MKSFFDKSKSFNNFNFHLKYSSHDVIENKINDFKVIRIKSEKINKLPKTIKNNELKIVIINYNNQSFINFDIWLINSLSFIYPHCEEIIINNEKIYANRLYLSGKFKKASFYFNNFVIFENVSSPTEINYL
jgi:hypothetical protein